MTNSMTNCKREYEIEAATKTLQVLEALEGIGFEPVTVSTVVGRTGFTRDFCFRALKTLQMRGYAVPVGRTKWTTGKRWRLFKERAAIHSENI